MRPNEFKLECMVFTSCKTLEKALIDFGVFKNSVNIKHGDLPEIIIDKDIAGAILKKIAESESADFTISYKNLFEKYLIHVQEMYGHCCLDEAGFGRSTVIFSDEEKAYFEKLNIIN